jgi:acetylglutamate kinase
MTTTKAMFPASNRISRSISETRFAAVRIPTMPSDEEVAAFLVLADKAAARDAARLEARHVAHVTETVRPVSR